MKTPRRRRLSARTFRLNVYEVLRDAVEQGVGFGLGRAYKYSDNPTRDVMEENIEREVMNALSEVIVFESPE